MGLYLEDAGKWKRFYGSDVDPVKVREHCRLCIEESRRLGKPSEKAMNCWKIVVRFNSDKWDEVFDWVKEISDKYPRLTGELTDNILIIYFQSGREDMWAFRKIMIDEWCKRKLLPHASSYFIPYRRGGAYYDKEYGPWRTWRAEYYDLTGELKRSVGSLTALCPYDGAILEKHGNKLECPLCGFKIPLNVLYEVLEFGEAEYELKSGPYKNKVYRVRIVTRDRVEVEELNPCS